MTKRKIDHSKQTGSSANRKSTAVNDSLVGVGRVSSTTPGSARLNSGTAEEGLSLPPAELVHRIVASQNEGRKMAQKAGTRALLLQYGLRHPPFPAAVRQCIAQIQRVLLDVRPLTVDQWEFGFRCDVDPALDIRLWSHIARCYRHFTRGRPLTLEQKKDVYAVIFWTTFHGWPSTTRHMNKITLSPERASEIAAYVAAGFPGGDWKVAESQPGRSA
jgi:hypothetical protein